VRNTVKRRLRAAVRALLPGIVRGYDVVIIARPTAAAVPFVELAQAVETTLQRARLLRGRGEDAWLQRS
jgi:ribonuclease P protein component